MMSSEMDSALWLFILLKFLFILEISKKIRIGFENEIRKIKKNLFKKVNKEIWNQNW